ncbi:hypothetical protein AB0C86_38905 [Streptomyces lavendulae]|uniref:hypothetical protein n=1 Tax=Streptomyces lavendulae TaxID=1914 RepID=UPI003405CC5E
MDQGLAAVLGGCVGVAGTLGTGVLAYLAARHQVRDQGKAERKRLVRSERREAYRGFLKELSELTRDLDLLMLTLVGLQLDGATPEQWFEKMGACMTLSNRLKALKITSNDIMLAGPAEIALLVGPAIRGLDGEWGILHQAVCAFKWEREEQDQYESSRQAAAESISALGARASIILNSEDI